MEKKIDLGKTPIHKLFIAYAIPSILAILGQMLAGLVDSFFVGRYVSKEGLSAVALLSPIVSLLLGVAVMVAIGGTTYAGIHLGKREIKKANNYFNVTIALLIGTGIFSTMVLYFGIGQFTTWLGADGGLKELVVQYGRTLSFFFVFFLTSFALLYFLKLDEKPNTVVAISISGVVINVVLDYLFVYRFSMGMEGAALATGISQLLPWGAAILVIIFRSKWRFAIPIFRKKELGLMLFNGSSELLSMIAVSVSGFVFNFLVLRWMGQGALSAYAIALQIYTVVSGLCYGIAEASQGAISYNFGANQLDRVRGLRKLSLFTNLIFGVLAFWGVFLLGEQMASVFVKNQQTIRQAVEILRNLMYGFLIMGVNISVGTYYTSVNDPLLSGLVTLLRSLVGILVGVWILPQVLGVQGIWWTIFFAETVTLLCVILLLKKHPYGLKKQA